MEKHIVVIAEQLKGKLSDTTFEMLGQARVIADQVQGKVIVLLYGNDSSLCAQLGAADTVLFINHPVFAEFNPEACLRAIEEVITEVRPWLTFIGATSMGLDIASPLSAKMRLPLVVNCCQLSIEDGRLLITSQVYGGKMFAQSVTGTDPALITIMPGAFKADAGRSQGAPAREDITLHSPFDDLAITFNRLIEPEAGDIDITQSPVLVSVGRGIQSQDNLALAQELSDALHGAVSASRPVVDQGWLPMTRQIGRSGMIVKPKVYFALGISGAPEHIEGMRDSELIIAVNSDAQAPIFDTAHYGVVCDVLDLLPALTSAVK